MVLSRTVEKAVDEYRQLCIIAHSLVLLRRMNLIKYPFPRLEEDDHLKKKATEATGVVYGVRKPGQAIKKRFVDCTNNDLQICWFTEFS